MNQKDWRDFLTYGFAAAILAAATAYLFRNHSDGNFVTWVSACTVLTGMLRWLDIHDDKTKDAVQ